MNQRKGMSTEMMSIVIVSLFIILLLVIGAKLGRWFS
jgi:hypothetical protein